MFRISFLRLIQILTKSNFVVKRQHLLPLAKTPTKGSTTSTALRRFFTRALQLLPFDNKMSARKYQRANSDNKIGASYNRNLAELVVDSENINSNRPANLHLGGEVGRFLCPPMRQSLPFSKGGLEGM